MKNKTSPLIIFLSIIVAVVFLLLLLKPSDYALKLKQLDKIILKDLNKYGIEESSLMHRSFQKKDAGALKNIDYLVVEYNVPSEFSLKSYERKLSKLLDSLEYKISQSQIKKQKGEYILTLLINFKQCDIYSLILHQKIIPPAAGVFPEAFVYPAGTGKVAIVLDDWGYNLKDLEKLGQINRPMTLAVLPGSYTKLKLSSKIAQSAADKKYEVILHLPLEPKEYQGNDTSGFITTEMKKEEIIKSLKASLESVPLVKGISNHEGSKATEDDFVMRTIFEQMRQRHLYYLDSATGAHSVCPDLAKELKLKFNKRDIFLDNKAEKEYIKNQLRKLAVIAIKKGQAVGIGHDRIVTLEAIKEMAPELEKAGITFVYLSELVK